MTGLAATTPASNVPTLASFGHDPWWIVIIKVLIIFLFLMLTTLMAIWAERRILGRMQNRSGPNRAGKFGLLQSLMDGIKLALMEDIVPRGVDRLLFMIAPAISVIPAFIGFAVIPWGPIVSIGGARTPLQLTDLPVAVLLLLAMSSLGVYGIVLAGWSASSPYSLLGGLRSSAQVISYEIAMGLSFVPVFLYAGSLSTSQIVAAQIHGPAFHFFGYIWHWPSWFAVLLLPSFLIYLVTMVGETNRLPFDLPEGEGELVGGYHTEYSSLKFAMLPAGRVRQRDHRLRAGHHAVPRRLAGAVADQRVVGRGQRLVAGAVVPGQGARRSSSSSSGCAASLPRDPLRPADAAGLEGAHPVRARLDAHRGDRAGVPAAGRQPGGLHHRRRDHRRPAGAAVALGVVRAASRAAGRGGRRTSCAATEPPGPSASFPTPPLDLPHYHGIGAGRPGEAAWPR